MAPICSSLVLAIPPSSLKAAAGRNMGRPAFLKGLYFQECGNYLLTRKFTKVIPRSYDDEMLRNEISIEPYSVGWLRGFGFFNGVALRALATFKKRSLEPDSFSTASSIRVSA